MSDFSLPTAHFVPVINFPSKLKMKMSMDKNNNEIVNKQKYSYNDRGDADHRRSKHFIVREKQNNVRAGTYATRLSHNNQHTVCS